MKKGTELELEISDIAIGGKGFAKVDGFAVFVDKTITKDKVLVRITKKKKNFAEAKVIEYIEPSEFRVDTPCSYSGYCGGCKWQFLDYEKQLEYKTRHVKEALEHIGMVKDVIVHPALASEKIFGYRNKMEFSCSDQRWLMPEELGDPDIKKGFGIGLHVPGTFFKVLDIEKCWLTPDPGSDILADVRAYIKTSDAPVYGLHSHEGFWRFLMLRHSVHHNNWMVNIITAYEDMDVVMPLKDMLMKKYPEIACVVNNITDSRSGVATDGYEIHLGGEKYITDKLGEYEFNISANSFFQTNTRGAEALYNKVKEYAGLTGAEKVLDLYSGTGTIPLWLSKDASEVTGIEIVESAVIDARKNAVKNGVDNCSFIIGDIKDSLSQAGFIPDVLIIDPPRAGMHKDVVRQVLELSPEKIVYVSCNPSTLARDVEMLKSVYMVAEVQPVDMFPHTFHIEAVARLVKK